MTDQQHDIDIEAEQKLFEALGANEAWHLERYDSGEYKYWNADCAWKAHVARARLAAERERSLLDLLADAQHAVCCYSCPEPREGEPDRHCDLCQRITAALGTREDGVTQTVLTANAKPLFEFDERSFVDLEELKRRGFVCRIATVAVSNPETGEEKILMLPLGEERV